jgi:anaerobic selenocysteine-containing dehydrogenase
MRQEFYPEIEGRTYVAPQYGHEITVRVGDDLDQAGCIAMSREAMEELGVRDGDYVEIYGAWMQRAKAVLSKEKDITVVRIHRRIREALPCAIGQHVGIRKAIRNTTPK